MFAILDELNLPYKILDIKYNWLANLPNFILQIFGGYTHILKTLILKKLKLNQTSYYHVVEEHFL